MYDLLTENPLNQMLVELLVVEKRYYEFHQHLLYHILNDSMRTAMLLVDIGETEYPPALQLGMDMLYRLEAFGDLLRLLLKKSKVSQSTCLCHAAHHMCHACVVSVSP